MATIALGYFLRSVARMIRGTDDFKIETPFSQGVLRLGNLVLAHDKLSVIAAKAQSIMGSTSVRSPRLIALEKISRRQQDDMKPERAVSLVR